MKNPKGKLRKRNWSDADWSNRMRKRFKKRKKGLDESWNDEDLFFGDFQESKSLYDTMEYNPVVTNGDAKHASDVLVEFVLMEKSFISYLRDLDSWELVGEGDDGTEWVTEFSEAKDDCGCE
jgi:hypothetical protein